MKRFLIFLLWVALGLGAKDMGNDWTFVRESSGLTLWKLKKDNRVIGTLQSKTRKKDIDWKSIRSKAFFEKLASEKQRILGFMGISEWEAKNYQWKNKGSIHELSLEGTYRDSRYQKVAFREHHLYGRNGTHQILLVRPHSLPEGPWARDFIERAVTRVLP